MKKSIRLLLVLVYLIILLGTFCSPNKNKNKLVLTGSSTIAPLAMEIGKLFERKNPNVQVNVQTGGSSRGITDVRKGLNDIGMASRTLKKSEKKLYSFTIAKDGVCIILHKSSVINKLTKQQVIDIFTGKINNWKEVGGQNEKITVVNKAEGRATLEVFTKFYGLKNKNIIAHVVIGDNEQGIKTVIGNKNAIAYVSIGTAEYNVKHGVAIKLLATNNVTANIKNLANGSFPIFRPLNLITKVQPLGLVKKFIEFARSKQVEKIIQEYYFVPITKNRHR